MKVYSDRIDFLRGVAIFLVFIYHVSIVIFGPEYQIQEYEGFFIDFNKYSIDRLLKNLSPYAYGWSGVELFLVISGFLIHAAYLRAGNLNTFSFFNKRFWRIWPPYFITLIFFTITLKQDWLDFIIHALLLHNLHPLTFHSINGSFWSLALEAQLYLVYPLFLCLRKRFGLEITVMAILTLQIISAIIEYIYSIENLPYHFSLLKFWSIWVMGAYLAEKYVTGKMVINIKSIYLTFFLILLLFLKFTIIYKYFRHLLFGIFFMLLVEKVLHSNNKKIFQNKFFSFTVTLGICSYSFYLLHQPFLGWLINKLRLFENTGFGIVAIAGTFFILFIISYVNYKLIELPSINFGKKIYKFFQERENRSRLSNI